MKPAIIALYQALSENFCALFTNFRELYELLVNRQWQFWHYGGTWRWSRGRQVPHNVKSSEIPCEIPDLQVQTGQKGDENPVFPRKNELLELFSAENRPKELQKTHGERSERYARHARTGITWKPMYNNRISWYWSEFHERIQRKTHSFSPKSEFHEANSTDRSLSCRIWAVLSYIPVDYQWFPTVIYDYQEVTFNSGMFMYYTELVQA